MGLFFRVFDFTCLIIFNIAQKFPNIILSIRFTPKLTSNNLEFLKNKNIVLLMLKPRVGHSMWEKAKGGGWQGYPKALRTYA